MGYSNYNKSDVVRITVYTQEGKQLLRIVTANRKEYHRQYYTRSGRNCFIYNNGWYMFKIDSNKVCYDIRYWKAYKENEDTTFRMNVRQNERTDTMQPQQQSEPEQTGTVEELSLEEEPTEVVEETPATLEETLNEVLSALSAEVKPVVPVVEEIDWSKPVKHMKYGKIKKCIENNIPIYLAGPAGSGKNHVLEQIAAEMGMGFYFSNAVQQEYKLTGFIDAGGTYHETEFYRAASDENECIFFLDEMDASIPEVLVLLNAAIANGYFEFPVGRMDINHIRFVAAGNTAGSGSDDKYTGRMVIDSATLDRFGYVKFDYDMNIELHLTRGNKELVDFVHDCRLVAERGTIRATFSYRCMTMVAKLEKADMELVDIMEIAIMKGLDKDTVKAFNPAGYSKYHKALREYQRAV